MIIYRQWYAIIMLQQMEHTYMQFKYGLSVTSSRSLKLYHCVIVINPNGTSPLECRHSLCWYTKGHFRIEYCQNTIDGHDMRCIYPSTSLPYYFSKCWFPYATIFNSHTYMTIPDDNSRTVCDYLHYNLRTDPYAGFL